jgi:hypothetical protein
MCENYFFNLIEYCEENNENFIYFHQVKIIQSLLLYQILIFTFNADKNKFFKNFKRFIKLLGNNNIYLKSQLGIFSTLFLNLQNRSIDLFLTIREPDLVPYILSNLFLSKIYSKELEFQKSKFHFSIGFQFFFEFLSFGFDKKVP